MPLIRFSCPRCQQSFDAPAQNNGQKFDCSCGQRLQIPAAPLPPVSKTVLGKVEDFMPKATRVSSGSPPLPPPIAPAVPSSSSLPWALPVQLPPNRGVACMVLGIISCTMATLGLVFCAMFVPAFITGVIAWALASSDLAGMRRMTVSTENKGMVTAGHICGFVGMMVSGVILAFAVIAFVAAIGQAPRW